MIVKTQVVDESGRVLFGGATDIDALRLMVVAESREEQARDKGAEFTAGAIPFFGSQLVEAFKARKSAEELELAATNVALATWLHESIHCGLTAEEFLESDLLFTIRPDGAVAYTRMPADR